MPTEDEDYSDMIESYIKSIEAMPSEQQETLRAAYIFSRKAPQEERQDLFQHLVAHVLKIMANWQKPITSIDGFCYMVARHEWKAWTRNRKRRREILNGGFVSLEEPVRDSPDGGIELKDTIADDLDLESELNSELDHQALLNTLPDRVKAVVVKRLAGQKVSHLDYKVARRYIQKNWDAIREAIRA